MAVISCSLEPDFESQHAPVDHLYSIDPKSPQLPYSLCDYRPAAGSDLTRIANPSPGHFQCERPDVRTLLGLARSLWIYRASPSHHRGLVGLYGEFVPRGGLVFDVGAHVGDRIKAFRALGARVVALEPQKPLYGVLKLLHGFDRKVILIRSAAGRSIGEARFRINSANPTVSTLSEDFVAASKGAKGWEGQVWDRTETIELTTLDALIALHGRPDFIKIDVEGFEAEIIAGLSHPVPALSFEIVTMAKTAGLEALDAAISKGFDRFRISLGESHAWSSSWTGAAEMRRIIHNLPAAANSGDVYARRDWEAVP